METQIITVLDRATEMGVLVNRITAKDSENKLILKKAGFYGGDYIFYTPLDGFHKGRTETDPFKWNDRTHKEAHYFIQNNWADIGDIVDVEEILGEKTSLKDPEFTEELRKDVNAFIEANGFIDTRFYSRSGWEEKGETLGVDSYGSMIL